MAPAAEIFLSMFLMLVLTQLSQQCENDLRIQCACGKSGNNITICYSKPRLEFDECDNFRHCATCSDYSSHCLSCPLGKSGFHCTENVNQTVQGGKRYKRQSGGRCPDLPAPKLGSIRCWSSRYDKECIGRCLPGHSFRNFENEEMTLKCQNGRWQPRNSFPQCSSDGYCELEMNGAGSYNCTVGVQGTRCDIRCTGRPFVNSRFFCYPGDDWKPPLPHCTRAKGEKSSFEDCLCQNGGTCDATTGACRCPSGYNGRQCETENYPVRSYCDDPGRIANGDRMVDYSVQRGPNQMYSQGSVLTYSCRRGFTLRGSSRLTCLQHGSWSSDLPSCQRTRTTTTTTTTTKPRGKSCIDPGFIHNGLRRNVDGSPSNMQGQTFPEGSPLVYSCKSDFALRGQSLITCLSSGLWSHGLPQCIRITPTTTTTTTTEAPDSTVYCDDPGRDPNGDRVESVWLDARKKDTANKGLYPQGMQLEYSCRDGYSLLGEETITCLYTGYWSNSRPICQRAERNSGNDVAYCNDPGFVANSDRTIVYSLNERHGTKFVDDGDVRVPEGVKIEYTCDDGLEIAGKSTITCLPTGTWSDPPPECRSVCGRSFTLTTTRRIIRGNRTSAGDWPWQVAIGVSTRGGSPEIICGGVLVNSRTILTAAHCLDGVKMHRTTLFFGKYYLDPSKDDQRVLKGQPTTIMTHPRYNRQTYDYDIAIVRFAPDVKMSNRIQPICLPNPETTRNNLVNGNRGYVVGWGLTEHDVYPEILLMAKVPFVSKEKCENAYREQKLEFPITENMYCAGYDEVNSDSCTGDSGGPMTFQNSVTKRFVLEGLVSYGVWGGCGLPRRYTVYTKVGHLMRWVRANM